MKSNDNKSGRGMNEIMELDKRLLIWLNSFHATWMDPIMYWMTNSIFWMPLYLIMAFLIFKNFKSEGWFVILGIGLGILLADRVTDLMKIYFQRPRPSHEPALEAIIYIVNGYRGGKYGFASGHAANTFSVAMLFWLVFRKIYKFAGLIFLWAVLMTYTRIYLGVHYPGDIVVGAIVGLLSGWIGFIFYRWLATKWKKNEA